MKPNQKKVRKSGYYLIWFDKKPMVAHYKSKSQIWTVVLGKNYCMDETYFKYISTRPLKPGKK